MRLCRCLRIATAAPAVVTHCCSCPGTSREGSRWGCWVIGSHSAPVMGRNAHVIFREFQEVFGSRHPAVRHKEGIVCLPSQFSCAQVTNADSIIVTALAGMACSLWGLTRDRSGRTAAPPPHPRPLHSPLCFPGPIK